MKYIVVLGDGMAGEPLAQLGGRTTLEAAATPNMDALASMGTMGLAKMVPDGMKPGSDVANLAVLGYDPKRNYSGRSPLEALSVGVAMEPEDIVFRCNLVTLSEDEPYECKTIIDHSSGEISSEDADVLMDSIRAAFNNEQFQFFSGTSYRHITVWKNGCVLDFEQPHDHLGEVIGAYLPKETVFRQMMEKSFDILNNHPLNLKRAAEGKNKANSLWFWGAGTKPSLNNFEEKTGLKGTMISAVDLLKGIAVGAGMQVVNVAGATGSLHTNYEGKAAAAVKALLEDGQDFVYIHVEAPDEMGHQGSMTDKIQAIEYLDSRIIAPVKAAMDASGEPYRMLILPDHPTPIRIRTHSSEPVPYIIYDSRYQSRKVARYTEKDAAATGEYTADGYELMAQFLQKVPCEV
ncbi:MAG: cofactor-independent phosphoglycerate mutase [Oscillospiraceae bacterium]|nr:cofactor-independent phosphoglycerate mutase [Oscillospiraceae bacterium]